MTPKVSVIIPVYNVEKYLRRCLDSIVNQTLKELEIIIVNDASPDESEAIILEYAKSDPRIKYIKHEVNKGVGGARNTGIKEAKAPYLYFIDSDDWLELKALEISFNKIVESDADVLQFGVKDINEKNKQTNKKIILKRTRIIKNKILISVYVWNKLYKTSFLKENGIYFPEKVYYEDELFRIKIIYFCKKAILINDQFYHYFNNSESITKSPYNEKKMNDVFLIIDEINSFLKDKNYEKLNIEIIIHSIIYHYNNLNNSKDLEVKFREKTLNYIKSLDLELIIELLKNNKNFSQNELEKFFLDYKDILKRKIKISLLNKALFLILGFPLAFFVLVKRKLFKA